MAEPEKKKEISSRSRGIGSRIKLLRLRYGKQLDFGSEIFGDRFNVETEEKRKKNISVAMSRYESGTVEPPLDVLVKVCELANCSLDWLVMGKGPQPFSLNDMVQAGAELSGEEPADIYDQVRTALQFLQKAVHTMEQTKES